MKSMMMLLPAMLLFSGCSTTKYIPTPCPTIKPLSKLPDLRFHVEKGQIDRNATRRIIEWARDAKLHDEYYRTETTRLKNFNKEHK